MFMGCPEGLHCVTRRDAERCTSRAMSFPFFISIIMGSVHPPNPEIYESGMGDSES